MHAARAPAAGRATGWVRGASDLAGLWEAWGPADWLKEVVGGAWAAPSSGGAAAARGTLVAAGAERSAPSRCHGVPHRGPGAARRLLAARGSAPWCLSAVSRRLQRSWERAMSRRGAVEARKVGGAGAAAVYEVPTQTRCLATWRGGPRLPVFRWQQTNNCNQVDRYPVSPLQWPVVAASRPLPLPPPPPQPHPTCALHCLASWDVEAPIWRT